MTGLQPRKSDCRLVSRYGICLLLILPFLIVQGCGSKTEETATGTQAVSANGQSGASSATASDADMKKSFSQKSFDINNVPPEQRERVKALMQQNAPSQPSATSTQGK